MGIWKMVVMWWCLNRSISCLAPVLSQLCEKPLVCVCACVLCNCLYMLLCAYVCMCFKCHPQSLFETGSPAKPGSCLLWLASKPQKYSCLCLQGWVYTHLPPSSAFSWVKTELSSHGCSGNPHTTLYHIQKNSMPGFTAAITVETRVY